LYSLRRYITPWVMSAAALLIGVAAFSPLGLRYALALAAVLAALVYLYLRAVTHLKADRTISDWRLEVKPERLWMMTPATFDKLRYALSDSSTRRTEKEDKVYLATRRHWIYLVRQASAPMLLALVFLGVTTLAGNIVVHLPQNTHHRNTAVKHPYDYSLPHQFTIPWWLPVLLAMACVLVALVMSAEWFFRFVIITNLNVILLRVTPVWLPWMKKPKFPWALSWIEHEGNLDSFWGNLLGYGAVQIDTPSEHDEPIRRIEWMPRHEEFIQVLQSVLPDRTRL